MIEFYSDEELLNIRKKLRNCIVFSIFYGLIIVLCIIITFIFADSNNSIYFNIALPIIWVIFSSMIIYNLTIKILPLKNTKKHYETLKKSTKKVVEGTINFNDDPFTFRKDVLVQKVTITNGELKTNCLLKTFDGKTLINDGECVKAIVADNFIFSVEVKHEKDI